MKIQTFTHFFIPPQKIQQKISTQFLIRLSQPQDNYPFFLFQMKQVCNLVKVKIFNFLKFLKIVYNTYFCASFYNFFSKERSKKFKQENCFPRLYEFSYFVVKFLYNFSLTLLILYVYTIRYVIRKKKVKVFLTCNFTIK